MARQIALLRAVNLARNRRLAMADLRALVEALGYDDVRTHLQSGNIVLSWTGASNIQLQMTASLSSANWQIVSGTSGTSSYQISASGGGNAFYRLVQQ